MSDAAYMREYKRKNRDKLNAYQRKWNAEHPESVRSTKRKYRAKLSPEEKIARSRKYNLKASYGISVEDYQRMYDEQHGRCAICQKPFPVLAVDHNHRTEKVRGLLCFNCNTALGNVDDNILVLLSAVSYLEQHNG